MQGVQAIIRQADTNRSPQHYIYIAQHCTAII